MIYGDACAGISAPTVAWAPLGWKCAFHAEIAPFPRAVLQHHYPHHELRGNITQIQPRDHAPVDLLVAGTPCQAFSVAGQGAGIKDPRGLLTLDYLALAARLQPRWIILENVPRLLSIDKGRTFATILGALEQLRYGYAWRLLDARHFGLAQRRKRLFLVAHLGNWKPPATVLLEPESGGRHPEKGQEAGEDIAGTLSARTAAGGGAGTDFDLGGGLVAYGGNNTAGPIDVATACNAHGGPHGRLDFETETFAVAFAENSRAELRLENGDGQITGALSAGGGKPGQGYPAIMHTLRAEGADASEDGTGRGPSLTPTPSSVRRLTPREWERLQGFPDDYTLIPYRNGMAKDGPRYKAIGNSIPIPIMRWIGERIEKLN